ncbi:uncharacterized protein NMK_2127 [Novimethylophilus kurashikiensis]|uniref:Uncharacterized protein n=1 Tax=Novimethylophilus kurashikiensis TaxID=1825523 RepID=A0A2R5FAF3_9PROT|nr:uncharacterized protein NMK_2127 [Novimethylophilus kurashikiensis]
MTMLPVYVRKEPTRCAVTLAYGPEGKKDTVFYRDSNCTQLIARKPWHQSGHPTRRSSTVTLNCNQWSVNWVN